MPAGRDLERRRGDGLGHLRIQAAERGVGARRRGLDQPQRTYEPARQAQATDGKILDRALGLGPVEGIGRHPDLAHAVVFDPKLVLGGHHGSSARQLVPTV